MKPSIAYTLATMAAAIVLSGCGTQVKTVTTQTPTSTASQSNATPNQSSSTRSQSPTVPSSTTQCDPNISVSEPADCAFAENAFYEYWTNHGAASFSVYSPATKTSSIVKCSSSTDRITCSTDSGGSVRFPRNAVDAYTQAQADHYANTHEVAASTANGNVSTASNASGSDNTGNASNSGNASNASSSDNGSSAGNTGSPARASNVGTCMSLRQGLASAESMRASSQPHVEANCGYGADLVECPHAQNAEASADQQIHYYQGQLAQYGC